MYLYSNYRLPMKTTIYHGLFLLIISAFLASCAAKKKMIYFQGDLGNQEANKNYNPVFHTDDVISIIVMGMDAETVKPFNLPAQNITNSLGGGYSQGIQTPIGYLVDVNGNIDFPVIGQIKTAGLTRSAMIDSLKLKLKPYLSNATILIRILNFKVTVLGEVKTPGTFTIPNERVTLPEALGIAGDLLITGKRKNVMVIRDTEGKKTEHRIDLTSKDLFSSPVYYLNQNDVVYVEPNRPKINSSVINQVNAAIIISAASLITAVMTIVRNK